MIAENYDALSRFYITYKNKDITNINNVNGPSDEIKIIT